VIRAVLVGVVLCGCRGQKRARPDDRGPAAVLRLLPGEVRYVVGADVPMIRAAPITAKLGALRVVFESIAKEIDAFTKRTGVDPWTQIDSITMAGATLTSETAIVIRGRGLDEARLTGYAREQLAASGDELVGRPYRKRTLWSARKAPDRVGVFLDAQTLVLAKPGWVEKIADIADGDPDTPTAASNGELVRACAEVSANPIWAAGVLPDEAREMLQADFQLRALASMRQVTLAVELTDPLIAKLAVAFGDGAQADQLAEELAQLIDKQRRETRDRPYMQALFKGLTEYADGTTFRAELRLPNEVVASLAETSARFANARKPENERPQPTAHPLTMKADWLVPPPASLALGEIRSYDAWDRQTHLLMELTNRTADPVVPNIVVRFRDANDKGVGERRCLLPMVVLLGHERAACDPGVPAGAATGIYTIRTAPDDRAALAAKSRVALKVLGARMEAAEGTQGLSGQVKNTGTTVVHDANVHAIFYDADNKIVGFGDATAARELAPGASAPFRLASGPLFAPAESFAVIGYGIAPPAADTGTRRR
jgi:hypothetical protein